MSDPIKTIPQILKRKVGSSRKDIEREIKSLLFIHKLYKYKHDIILDKVVLLNWRLQRDYGISGLQ